MTTENKLALGAFVILLLVFGFAQSAESAQTGDCQEDEDWATVHYQDPRGSDDPHGVTRACVNREELVMDGINELILDGTLIWEWDLPDKPEPIVQTIVETVTVVEVREVIPHWILVPPKRVGNARHW